MGRYERRNEFFFWVSFKENAKNETNLVLFVDTEFFSSIFELKIFM